VLTSAHADPKRNNLLRRLFHFETILTRKPLLVEKLPANSFRLGLIREIFPHARFLHLQRNGLQVARSIEAMCNSGSWFGANGYKWQQLVAYAMSREATSSLPPLCSNSLEKGLLEWRLSTEAIVDFLRSLPDETYLEVSYHELVNDPVSIMHRVFSFLGMPTDAAVTRFVRENVHRKSDGLQSGGMSERQRLIGGPLLSLSVNAESLPPLKRAG
jgi:hypothetical protein